MQITTDPQKANTVQPGITPAYTGPEAIAAALRAIDIDKLEVEQKEIIRQNKKTKRPDAIKLLGYIQGFRRSGIHPADLMLRKIPVLPAKFRPYSVAGDTFIPGNANVLYKDLFDVKNSHVDAERDLGKDSPLMGESRLNVHDAVRALYGYGLPVNAKNRERDVSGFLRSVIGHGPKFGFVQRRMISKNVDFTARGVAEVDPELGLDEIGLPEHQAWKLFSTEVQRRLVRGGIAPSEAVQMIEKKDSLARAHLTQATKDIPVWYSRAPAWHKYNTTGGYVKMVPGDAILTNSLVTTGHNLDYDGDTMNVHLPSTPEAIKEVKEKLMPSKMLFSIKDPNKVVPVPKQEGVLGCYVAQQRAPGKQVSFPNEAAALAAWKRGEIDLNDNILLPD